MSLPEEPGWYAWRSDDRVWGGALPEPVYVHQEPEKGLCVMAWREVAIPVGEYGGCWGSRIEALEPKGEG